MSRRPGEQIIKDPSSQEPQGFDWTAYCAELGVGVTIVTSTWAVSTITSDAAPLVLSDPEILPGALKTKVVLSGGSIGRKYVVTNHIVTSTNVPVDERSFKVWVEQR